MFSTQISPWEPYPHPQEQHSPNASLVVTSTNSFSMLFPYEPARLMVRNWSKSVPHMESVCQTVRAWSYHCDKDAKTEDPEDPVLGISAPSAVSANRCFWDAFALFREKMMEDDGSKKNQKDGSGTNSVPYPLTLRNTSKPGWESYGSWHILTKKRRAWLSIGRPSPEVAELSARRDLWVVTLGAQTGHRHWRHLASRRCFRSLGRPSPQKGSH